MGAMAAEPSTAPTAVHDLEHAVVTTLAVGPMDNNAYLLTCRATGARVLIDAAAEPDRLLALLATGPGAGPDLVVTTHRHRDHLGALPDVVAATGAPVAAGTDDADAIEHETGLAVDRRLRHGDTVAVGRLHLDVVHLRGHTPGSVALALTGTAGPVHLFTGDSLFPGGVGNTGGDPDRFTLLLGDVVERVFDRYDDATVVHPGHGRSTTVGAERPHLDEWRDRGW